MFARQRIHWPPSAEEHIWARHRVTKSEVDSTLHGPVYARRVYVNGRPRYEVLGRVPGTGRVLKISLEDAPRGGVLVITAMPATLMERGLYMRRAKGVP